MAAPTPTARVTPTATADKLRNGHKTKITISLDPDICFWEKEVTPPGVDGGEAIPQGDMFDETWETVVPQALKTMTDMSLVANYAPQVLPLIISVVNVMCTITVTFPSGATWCFYGFVRSFIPNSKKRGEQPNANLVIKPTQLDPTDFSEAGPVYTAAA